jgi:diguanylate cyclase (GGDEF)-like protein
MRIERHIVAAGVAIAAVMALVAAIPYLLGEQVESAFEALAAVAARERAYESLLDTLGVIDYDRRAYFLTRSDVYLRSQAAALAALGPIRERLRAGAHDDGERARLRVIDREADLALADAARLPGLKERIAAEIRNESDERTRWRTRVTRAARVAGRSVIAAALLNMLILVGATHAVRRALRGRDAARERVRGTLLAVQRAADVADTRSRLLHRLQSVSALEDTPSVVAAHLREMYPGVAGAFYLQRAGQVGMERLAEWGGGPWPASLPPGTDGAAPRGSCVPLRSQGTPIGALCLDMRADDGVGQLGEQVALALANIELRATLRHQSLVDPLTQLYNRRFLTDALERELERAQRAQAPVSVVLIDLDHFKHVNDAYGHDTGDALLAMVGTMLREAVRGADVACRYGGEEMLAILPGCLHAAALERAEELRARIGQVTVTAAGGARIGVTASFGVATWPDHGASHAQIVTAADAALYRAKQAGRNRVTGAQARPEFFQAASQPCPTP